MAPHILEEACEAIDAIEDGKGSASTALCEELGDLLMNILLAARISEESGGFSFRELAQGIAAKLVRRHPHVFGGEKVSSVEEVLTRWNSIKASEKAEGSTAPAPSRLGEQPRSLPSLNAAFRVGEKAANVGFDWPDAAGALRKVEEELREVSEALDARVEAHAEANCADPEDPQARLRHEIGDLLFAAANLARKTGIEPESALRAALDRFRSRFRYIEERVDFSCASLIEMEKLWEEAKRRAV